MVKENQPPKVKKYHKILITVLILMFVVVGVIAWWQMSKYYEGYQMSSLDNHMRTLYQDIQLQAESDEDWVYETGCIEQKSGDFPTGIFLCQSTISMSKKVISVDEVSRLHQKYHSIISRDSELQAISDIQKSPTFGSTYSISYIGSQFKDRVSGATCDYSTDLRRTDDDRQGSNIGLGISEQEGSAKVRLQCFKTKLRSEWYKD